MTASTAQNLHPTKQRLIEAGLPMLLERGFNDLGIQALLERTQTPKGSFYHHFEDKQDFVLQVIDRYMQEVHAALDLSLTDPARQPLDRIRAFFEMTERAYRMQGYMGCLLGGLGQELSAVNETFRRKIEECFSGIARRLGSCLEAAKTAGDLPEESDTSQLADLLVNCWEGAALRSRLRSDPSPLLTMLDFYFQAVATEHPRIRRGPAE